MIPVCSEASTLKGRFAGRVKKPLSVEAMEEAMAGSVTAAVRRTTSLRKYRGMKGPRFMMG